MIELRNENGSIVGYDPETDEKVPVDFESVGVEEGPSNVLRPSPGELQDTLAAAPAGSRVEMDAEEDYDPGSETTIPQNVTLDFNGARWNPQSDYNGFYLEGGAELLNGLATTANAGGYTSTVLTVDSGRFRTQYRQIEQTDVTIEMRGVGEFGTTTGTVLKLVADGDAITLGNDIDIEWSDMGTGIDAVVNDGSHINGVDFRVNLKNMVTFIDFSNESGEEGPFDSLIRGTIQPGDQSAVGIRNNTGSRGPTFDGQLWDVYLLSGNSLEGPLITVFLRQQGDLNGSMRGTTSGDWDQTVYRFGDEYIQVFDGQNDNVHAVKHDAGLWMWEFNGNRVMDLNGSTGDVNIAGTLTEEHSF